MRHSFTSRPAMPTPSLASLACCSALGIDAFSRKVLLPSVIVPEEHTALLNPAHPAARHITATVLRPFSYNALFRAGA